MTSAGIVRTVLQDIHMWGQWGHAHVQKHTVQSEQSGAGLYVSWADGDAVTARIWCFVEDAAAIQSSCPLQSPELLR